MCNGSIQFIRCWNLKMVRITQISKVFLQFLRIFFSPNSDKKLAFAWANKMKSSGGRTAEDFQLRNRIFMQLIYQCQEKKLRQPFDRPPAVGIKIEDLKDFFVSMRFAIGRFIKFTLN